MVDEPVPAALGARVRECALAHQVTPFAVLLATLEVLLSRYAGQDDFAVGTVLSGRDRPELADVVGFVARTVALRSDLPGGGARGRAFDDLLRRVHERMLAAADHADLPFERLVDDLKLPRDPSRPALFSVLLVLQNTPPGVLALPDLSARPAAPDSRAAQFDLSFYVTETTDGFTLGVEFDTDLFTPATARRVAGHFRQLLAAATAAPQAPVRWLPILSEAERHHQLIEWNDTAATYPHLSLGELIARQAAATPDAPAVAGERDAAGLTYAELDRRANRVAHLLIELGVAPGAPVGVGVGRHPDLLAALIGVLRAGAAYVPLDPEFPSHRLEMMADDAGLRWLVADSDTAARLPGSGRIVVLLDADERLARQPQTPAAVSVRAEQTAYVIYTSGSTGRPKGVVVSHGNVVRLFEASDPWYRFDERDVWTLFHSYLFSPFAAPAWRREQTALRC
jgi:non-ribosomal peptide synthetase component F